MELDKIDLMVLYALVHEYQSQVENKIQHGMTPEDARRSIKTFGITKVWGGREKHILDDRGDELMWEYAPGDRRPIPDGIVNRMIIRYGLGNPLFHSNQFYRIGRNLLEAGWLLPGETRFVPSLKAERFVRDTLDHRSPADWPYHLDVVGGNVNSIRYNPTVESVV